MRMAELKFILKVMKIHIYQLNDTSIFLFELYLIWETYNLFVLFYKHK